MNRTQKQNLIIGGRECMICAVEKPMYLLIQPVDEHDLAQLEKEVDYVQQNTTAPFALTAFRVRDWNTDLSPWSAPAAFGDDDFGAGAAATLDYVEHELLPKLKARYDTAGKTVLGGYSMAGLFALWCGYQTDAFDAIAAASPSVWFDGWMDYAKQRKMLASEVYLSLGDREEKTRNARMARVGDCIRRQSAFLEAASVRCVLEWNPGNHFKDTDIRTAKGFSWVMEQEESGKGP